MDHPEEVVGWGVDDLHKDRYDLDMSRWPTILGNNNLRAIPTMGLGMGALALEGIDPRAEEWLDLAIRSATTFLELFEDDGSYFEGISYVDFAFRTMFTFLEAHYRSHGDVDWLERANFRGITEYIVCLQNGQKADGTPDVINISDARNSTFPCVSSWIAKRSGDPLAQYAAMHFSNPGFYTDFLWYDPARPASPPPADLLNKHFNLDWVVSRTGWGPTDVVVGFRSGPPMNHEHADRNSIMVKAFGERLLTDPFGASYDPKQPHWLLRKTEAHNAVLVNGAGHQYHNGEEGTNASQASAEIINYVDDGNVVWWTSDATHAYRLVNSGVARVARSVLFVKPGLIVLVDRLEMKTGTAAFTIRLHPDNRDGKATFALPGTANFKIQRPNGAILGAGLATSSLERRIGLLDLPESHGVFPFLDLVVPEASASTVVTAMALRPAGESETDYPAVSHDQDSWQIVSRDLTVAVRDADDVPTFEVL
jgi:hypothetical protein